MARGCLQYHIINGASEI